MNMKKNLNPKLMQYIEMSKESICRKNNSNLNYFLGTQKLLRVRGKDWWQAEIKDAIQAYKDAEGLINDFKKTTANLIVTCRHKQYKVKPEIKFENVVIQNQYMFWMVEKRTGAGKRLITTLKWNDVTKLMDEFNLTHDERLAHIHANFSMINVNAVMKSAVQDIKLIYDALNDIDEMGDLTKQIPPFMYEPV